MMLPYEDRRRVRVPDPRRIHSGFSAWLHALARPLQPWRHRFRQLSRRARAIDEHTLAIRQLSTKALTASLARMRAQSGNNRVTAPAEVDELLAHLCELSFRTLGLRPYPVQIHCALIIAAGGFAEMATGEGKSLSTALAAILLALRGGPVHVLTSNDYLAERDAALFTPLYSCCGISVAAVTSETPLEQRQRIYAHDVVYTTGREILGDFLKDRLQVGAQTSDLHRAIDHALSPRQSSLALAMRGLQAVIVDEADSILIDEAVMPLILSAPRTNIHLADATLLARQCVDLLENDVHYQVTHLSRQIRWTDNGTEKLKEIQQHLPRIWRGSERCRELMTLALMARELFFREEHYVVQEGRLVLVDTQTGRLTPHRNLGIGLHQAVEAKEGLELSAPTETIARFSYQRFFRLFPHLSGISGTLREARAELWRTYNAPVIALPTYRPVIRSRDPWLFFHNAEDKYAALVAKIAQVQATGQPILLGTRTVAVSELLAGRLATAGIPCQLLNAVRHREEAAIIARAGHKGSVTIATNMAGRGTDIKLDAAARSQGGLFVIAVEPQSSGRLDRQLHGRSGRQGDPGRETTYASLEDELFVSQLSEGGRRLARILLPVAGEPSWLGNMLVHLLQWRAERLCSEKRLAILASDNWMDKHLSSIGTGFYDHNLIQKK